MSDLPDTPGGWLDLLDAAAEGLNETVTLGGMAKLDWTDTVKLLDRLRGITRTLGQIDANLVKHIYVEGEHGDVDVDGLGRVKIQRSRDRRAWDERGVAQAVIDARMEGYQEENGAGMSPPPWDVAEWLLSVYGVSYVRVTPLRAMGLNPEDFCEDTPGKPTVTLPPRD